MPSPLPGRPFNHRAHGLSDAIDGTNVFPGAMTQLANLIPSADTHDLFVPRPAASLITDFSTDSQVLTPGVVSVLYVVGPIVYGMVAELHAGGFHGKDVPFAYNVVTSTFETIAIPQGAAALPTTQATTGDWTPPVMSAVGNKICITHPGFAGVSTGFYTAWLDISSFTSNTITGSTHGNTTIDTFSGGFNPLTGGWTPGMTISDADGDIPANTVITAVTASSITISNPATGSHTTDLLTVSGGTATAPTYFAGNTNTNPLAAVPVSVAQMAGSAFYAVQNTVVITDALNATQVTNATQAVNMGNALNVTALAGLPLQSSTQGGIIQSIIAFQGDANMEQIMGNIFASPSTLTKNNLGVGVGTLAPNTIAATPWGLMFCAPDGVRWIDFFANVHDPIGEAGDGINVPFVNAVNPSRMCAAFNQNVYRISVINGDAVGTPTQEYWFDLKRKVWTGPHTFPSRVIAAYQGVSEHGFVIAPWSADAKLFTSAVTPTVNDTYTENGTALTWAWETCLLPDNQDVSMNSVIESTLAIGLPPTQSVNVIAYDDVGNTINQILLTGTGAPSAIWGSMVWGAFIWGSGAIQFRQRQLKWNSPLVFKQMQLAVNGNSILGLEIGNLYMRVEPLNYMIEYA